MKNTIPIVASAAVVLLALAGCSSGSTSPSGTSAGKQGGSSSSQTYSADDLVTILTKAQASLNAGGTIKDNAVLAAALKADGGTKSIASGITSAGLKYEPASCGTELTKALNTDSNGFGVGVHGVAAELNYSKGILAIITSANGSLPTSLASQMLTTTQDLYSACGDMKIVDGSATVSMTIKKISVHTNADQTYAFDETVGIAGHGSSTPEIESISGNLLIVDTGIGGTTADAVAAINAVVAAAKS